MSELILRLLIGGAVVSFFAVLSDILRPKSFAGLFGAAPSVALATLGLTIHQHGSAYAAREGRSMLIGAVAFLIYAGFVSWILRRYKLSALKVSVAAIPIWFAVSIGLCSWLCRRIW
jgi:hypothetical protein